MDFDLWINQDIILTKDDDCNICKTCGHDKFRRDEKLGDTVCENCLKIVYTINTSEKLIDAATNPVNQLLFQTKNRVVISGGKNNYRRRQCKWDGISSSEAADNKLLNEIIGKFKRVPNIIAYGTISNDDIANALLIYRFIKKIKQRRDPIKMGIIAKAFYWVSKDNHILYSANDLAKMFNIDKKYISKGNKIINGYCQDYPEFDNLIEKSPISANDIIDKIQYKFDKLVTNKDIMELKVLANRIGETLTALKNTTRAVICGIFNIYCSQRIPTITKSMICEKMSISDSSISKYSKVFGYLIYDRKKYNASHPFLI